MSTPLDRSKVRELLDLTGGDAAWVEQLMATYLADTATRLDALRAAVARALPEEVQRAAHGIKGSSANVGATQVAEACHRIERMAREDRLGGVAEALADLEAAFAAVSQDIPLALAGS